ncbi:hypothetical protein TNCV_1659121 [Trichonephila clavipes]|nr:hypothetical protein TNCV_1659121 [Trichonephila clavipes]
MAFEDKVKQRVSILGETVSEDKVRLRVSIVSENCVRRQGHETVLASSFYSQYGLPTISGLPLHDAKGRYRPEKSMTDSQKRSLAVGSNLFCSISM